MDSPPTKPAEPASETDVRIKIYLLPNLMTAGNLFCGFVALTKIVTADVSGGDFADINLALFFILLACIFDLLDGRVARMGGKESSFGREFDSLADIISFGVAPAFLVHRIVLKDLFGSHQEIGWFISSIYLICGAVRLARFNCLAAQANGGGGKEFLGFPIPAAAGLVASYTLLTIWWEEKAFAKGYWRFLLPVLMLFLSGMMVSEVKYPSFKTLDLKARRNFYITLSAILVLGSVLILREKILRFVLPPIFTAYLIYGFIRPRISRQMRREIEAEDAEDPGEEDEDASRPV